MKRKIKIAYIIPTLDRGGAERIAVDLLSHLNREIYEPRLIVFKRGGEWSQELENLGIPVIILKKKLRLDFYNFYQLYSKLKSFAPDIVHTHLGGDIYGRLAARLLKTPIIVSTEHNINNKESYLITGLKKITSRWADKIIAVSSAVKEDIIKRYRISADKIVIIHNGLNTSNFLSSVQLNDEGQSLGSTNIASTPKIILGFLGRLEEQKGLPILLEALSLLPRSDFKLLIGGQGSQAEVLRDLIIKFNLQAKVQLLGEIKNPAAFLNSLDIFILPSLWEGLGIVLLEAGLIGLPIIASDIDGIKEIITNNTGYLVPAGEAKALAEKISWLLDNYLSPTVQEKTKNLQQIIMTDFNIKKTVSDYEALYQTKIQKIKNYEDLAS